MTNNLTRKQIGKLLCPNRKNPESLIAWMHTENKDLFEEGKDFIKKSNVYFYNEDAIELFRLIANEIGYKPRKIDKELISDIFEEIC